MSPNAVFLWNVQRWDALLGTYLSLDAARAHGEHVIHKHFQNQMDRLQVPHEQRAVDWRMSCCGNQQGPGRFSHLTGDDAHLPDCSWTTIQALRPYWVVTGRPVRTGHVSTAWEIWQSLAHSRFDPHDQGILT